MSHDSGENDIHLALNRYQAVNLYAVLTDINTTCPHYNTGDWVNEIRFLLQDYELDPKYANMIHEHKRRPTGEHYS